LAFVGFSLTRHPTPIERLQAGLFVGAEPAPMGQVFRLWRASVSVGELEATIARYLGADPTRRAFESFRAIRGRESSARAEADIHILRFAEHLLASAIGIASSRLVLSLLLRRRNVSREAALRLVDDASAMLKYNRDLLQHALDFARQGITVFDRDLRLICWNREFRDLFDLPADMLHVGLGLEEVVRFNAERGLYGPGTADDFIAARLELLVNESEPFRLKLQPGSVIEVRSARMPDDGIVTTYTDVTRTVAAEEALEATNETLEQRVRERTEELVDLNAELARAKAQADEANLSKTRFLAAASHDLLQPLNAARLYATSLVERIDGAETRSSHEAGERDVVALAHNLDASLEAVEDILSTLLEISRLDAGAMRPEFSNFRIDEILGQLRIEFEPLAREKQLALIIVPSSLGVRSDRRLLSRLVQNFVSNAVKYTQAGRVLVGCRRSAGGLRIEVWDTGPGISKSNQKEIFREFARLAPAAKSAPGLGLGLSIVERLSRVLGHALILRSQPGRGSVFAVEVPIAEPVAALPRGGPAVQAPHRPLAGMNVLALDNDAQILEGLRILLEGWGCRVATAADWEAAEAQSQTGFVPDVMIADYHLDLGDGLAAIAAARAAHGAGLPAILITADRGRFVRARAAEQSVPVLGKPLKPAVLRSLLSQWRVMRPAAE
jgi:signal transduction histidine kinase